MKKLIGFLTFIGLMGLMTSCMEEVVNIEEVQEGQVAFIISDFKSAEQTKSAFEIVDSKLKFQWSADDAIGIFPEDGWQTEFSMEEGAGTSVAVFDGGSWGLKREDVYYAYYPFSKENFESKDMRERVKYSYVGQEAAFADGAGVVDLSDYDFMASGASVVENGSVKFKFGHLGALCRIRFTVEAESEISTVSLMVSDKKFPIAGYFDGTDKDGDSVIRLVGEKMDSKFEVRFPEGMQTYAHGDNVELYFLMPPVDLRDSNPKLRLTCTDESYVEFNIDGMEILAGMSYGWDFVLEEFAEPEWLGGKKANSYVISHAGTYSFPPLKGNSTESVGEVASVEVLWESYGTDVAPEVGDLVYHVRYFDNKIIFSATEKKGNALIAVKDEEGTILWSWHIWLTDQPEDQVYRNNAGTMMDRNLGAISVTSGDVGALGLLYQWGRKDPFLGASSISDDNRAVSTLSPWPSCVDSNESCGTIEYSIANPTTFIAANDNNNDWYYSTNKSTNDTRWHSTKTIYDPCPAGYRVPKGRENGVWYNALGAYGIESTAFDTINKGFNLTKESMPEGYLTENGDCWYPAAGSIYGSYGYIGEIGRYGYYWSSTTSEDYYASAFMVAGELNRISTLSAYRSSGYSVRCFKENTGNEAVPAEDLSLKGTANSYIVSEAGTYKLPTVQGNSMESVGQVSYADVIWETFGTATAPSAGDLVSDVRFADNEITFNASGKEGNALIAAMDANGEILWSWHIWLTDNPEDQVYRNNAGTMMDRNLGATSATPGEVAALGLLYQWGRKDPFLGTSSINDKTMAESHNAWGYEFDFSILSNSETGTSDYAVKNPTKYINEGSNSGFDWLQKENRDKYRWDSPSGTKTINDPCPPGYRVPYGGENGILPSAFGTQETIWWHKGFDENNLGFDFSVSASGGEYPLVEDAQLCWYPLTGGISDGQLSASGSYSYTWSCSPEGDDEYTTSHAVEFCTGGTFINMSQPQGRARALSVRCQKED